MHPGAAITLFWALFVISWLAASVWSRRPRKRVALGNELPYRVVMVLGFVLLFHLRQRYVLVPWHPNLFVARAAALASLAGFGFAWWARLHLGALWSANITAKPDHYVVATGPYALVRHPIYTGLIWASLCTLFAYQTGPSLARILGFGLIVLGYWMKARMEEDWLSVELGGSAYENYRANVPMLLPFWR